MGLVLTDRWTSPLDLTSSADSAQRFPCSCVAPLSWRATGSPKHNAYPCDGRRGKLSGRAAPRSTRGATRRRPGSWDYLAVTEKCPRRFRDQHPSCESLQNGDSSPRLTVAIRLAGECRGRPGTPAPPPRGGRRVPRLYSFVPRSSQWPSTRIRVEGHLRIQSALRCKTVRAAGRTSSDWS